MTQKIRFLGHSLSKEGYEPQMDKTEGIREFPVPTNADKVRSFVSLVGFYRVYIPGFSKIASPLYNLLKDKVIFKWGESHL